MTSDMAEEVRHLESEPQEHGNLSGGNEVPGGPRIGNHQSQRISEVTGLDNQRDFTQEEPMHVNFDLRGPKTCAWPNILSIREVRYQ